MKNLTILIGLLAIAGCSDEPTRKYSNEEECRFKESRTCLDESCTVLAKDYCRDAFLDSPNKLKVIQRTCERMKKEEFSCSFPGGDHRKRNKLCNDTAVENREKYIAKYKCD